MDAFTGCRCAGKFIVMKQKSFKRTTIHFAHPSTHSITLRMKAVIRELEIRELERQKEKGRIKNSLNTHRARDIRQFFIDKRCFLQVFCGFLGWIFGQGIFSFKKELICCRESNIVRQLKNCSVARGSFGIEYLLLKSSK